MADFRKKKSGPQTDFEGKKLERIYLGKIISCTEQNIAHDVYNASILFIHVKVKITRQWKSTVTDAARADMQPRGKRLQ